jgi:alkylhydroperoxidase/carboxymuconolactone decarboxylase family protein YurZ
MGDLSFLTPTHEFAKMRRILRPETEAAFQAFSKAAFSGGALSGKTRQLIAVAVAHVKQRPYRTGHTKAAQRGRARPQELIEAVWVAAETRAGDSLIRP